jgi:hypothetical protein
MQGMQHAWKNEENRTLFKYGPHGKSLFGSGKSKLEDRIKIVR